MSLQLCYFSVPWMKCCASILKQTTTNSYTFIIRIFRGRDAVSLTQWFMTFRKIVICLRSGPNGPKIVAGVPSEAQIRSQTRPFLNLWREYWVWDRFIVLLLSPVSIIPQMLHTHLYLHVALSRGTHRRSLGTFQQAVLFRNLGGFDRKVLQRCSSFNEYI